MGKQWDHFYTQTYCRLPPYIIGILLGYHLHKTKGQQSTTNAQLNKVRVLYRYCLLLLMYQNKSKIDWIIDIVSGACWLDRCGRDCIRRYSRNGTLF